MGNKSLNSLGSNNGTGNTSVFARRLNWSGLSYPQKFTIVAIIFVLPLLAFTPLIADRFSQVDLYGYKEAQGEVYLRQTWNLTGDLQLFHGAVINYDNGERSVEKIEEAQSRVDADLAILKSTSEQYDAALGIDFDINELQSAWDDLKSNTQNKIETGSDNLIEETTHDLQMTAMQDMIRQLIKQIGDKSYLILDPDLDTYYMMETVLIKLPDNQALMFELWHLTNEEIVEQDMTPAALFRIDSLISRIEANLLDIDQNIQTAIANNSNGFMQPIVFEPFQNYLLAVRSFTSLVRENILETESIQINSENVYASFNNASDNGNIFYQSASQALETGVKTRISTSNVRLYTSISFAALSVLAAFVIGISMMRAINRPLLELISATEKLSTGEMDTRIAITSSDEVGRAALAFNKMAEDLEKNRAKLSASASELERRSLELETIAEVGRDIAIIRDLDTLLNIAADLIRERSKYYHVGIYLADGSAEFVYLKAASGTDAELMMVKNHKLQIGKAGLIGNVLRTGRAYIASNTGRNAVHFENPILPETRSEITLPLRSHNITIGALDIHSNSPSAFEESDTQTLQILADQLAAAIENSQLVHQVERTLSELTSANRMQSQRTWQSILIQSERPGFEYDGLQVRPVPQNLPSNLLEQLESGKPIVLSTDAGKEDGKNTLIVPLMILNQIIGVIGLEHENIDHIWTGQEIAVAQAAAGRAALTLENARLLEESQRRAVKERTIFEATARIGLAVNIENILQATADELEKVLSGSEVIIQFQSDNGSEDENNRSI